MTVDPQTYRPTAISAAGWQLTYQDYDAVGNVGTILDRVARPTTRA